MHSPKQVISRYWSKYHKLLFNIYVTIYNGKTCIRVPKARMRKTEVMRRTKEHAGKSHVLPNESGDTVVTISRIVNVSRMFRAALMIKYCSAAGITTQSLDALPTPSRLAPDQPANGSLIDVTP